MNSRRTQMKWLLGLTALSLVPVYILIGWQSGGHGSADVASLFWVIEAGAWGLRALVEAWALVYLFQTVNDNPAISKVLITFEGALIGLIALTVGLVIIANGSKQPISSLPSWLYWVWSFGVAAFAPLMMGSVGFAYKVHQDSGPGVDYLAEAQNAIDDAIERFANLFDGLDQHISGLQKQIGGLQQRLDALEQQPASPVDERRQRIVTMYKEGLTQPQMADTLGVSVGTIRNDVKALGLNGNGATK